MEDGILQPAFDIPVAVFFRIEFRRIPRKVLSMDLRVLLQVGRHDFRPMNRGSVPDQEDRFGDVPPEMFQADNQFFRIDRAIKMPFEDLARNRQSGHRRSLSAKGGDALELRWLTFGCPGETDRFGIGATEFVFKHDLCAEPPRFFLSGANPASTKPGSVLRRARGRVGRAFAHSSPNHAASG